MTAAQPVDWTDDHVLVACPRCQSQAQIAGRSGRLRLTCASCGHVHEDGRDDWSEPFSSGWLLETYGSGGSVFGERLWLEADCCGGHRLWALNARHLDYVDRFVRSTHRDAEFPSVAGARQLSDRLPRWIADSRHRGEIARTIDRLRATLKVR